MTEEEIKKRRRHEKDKIRQRTVRYLERYCDLDKKCQICNSKVDVQIHHPNYNDYLKINLLCRKHHTDLHNFELVPPTIIDLERIRIKKPLRIGHTEYVGKHIEDIKRSILNEGMTFSDMTKKYNTSPRVIRKFLTKEENEELSRKSVENGKNKRKAIANFK